MILIAAGGQLVGGCVIGVAFFVAIGQSLGSGGFDALYLTVSPAANDGDTVHRLTVRDVPVDGFWSITVYNADGYFTANPADAYSVNSVTAARDADGAVTVQFGGDPDGVANHLPVTPGWNYLVRLYRPRPQILDGSRTFPEAQRA